MADVAINDRARVFVFPNGVLGCNQKPTYGDCFSVDGLTQDGGDVTKVECPDPKQYGRFVEVASFRGERGRLTTKLTKRMTLSELSFLRTLFDQECPGDVHIHWGQCTDPTAFNQYQLAWILPKAYFTNWSTDTTIAQTSGDRAPVNESVDVSAADFYQVLAVLRYSRRASALTPTNPIVDVILCDARACAGDACQPSTGCDKYYALDNVNQIFRSTDGGATWAASTIPAANVPSAPIAMACVGSYLVVVLTDGSISWINRNDFDLGVTTSWRTSTAVLSGTPTDILGYTSATYGAIALITTATGNIYTLDENILLTLTDNTAAGGAQINGIATNGDVSLMVGNAGMILVNDGLVWSASPTTPTANALHTALVKSTKNWYVGGANGELWCTTDGGCTWNRTTFPDYNAGGVVVTDLCQSNEHVIWMTANGKVYRSIDGGSTWVLEPNDSTPGCRAAVTALGSVSQLACCVYNSNRVVAVGTATAGGGLILLGE